MEINFYFKARRLVSKGCASLLSYVYNISTKSHFLDSILIVFDFSMDLLVFSHEHVIEFTIEFELGTRRISITPYHIDPTKLKELNT